MIPFCSFMALSATSEEASSPAPRTCSDSLARSVLMAGKVRRAELFTLAAN